MVVGIVFFCVLVLVILRAMVDGPAGILALETKGLRARGLVLSCSSVSMGGMTFRGRRFEKRRMTLDIEVPGAEPYETSGYYLIPRGVVEPVPGASLDLAVHRSKKNKIAVLGPGGFSGPWIRVGPASAY